MTDHTGPPVVRSSARGLVGSRLRLVSLVLLFAVPAGLVCGWLYRRDAHEIEARLRERQSARAALFAHFLRSELRPAVDHLRILANGDGLAAFLSGGAPADRERAVRAAAFVSRQHDGYDQVSYLDESGRERLRVDRGGQIAPEERLRIQADRLHFRRASALGPAQVYLSAFDLNVENGRVEEPFKPTIRLATPVFDRDGRRRGVYVVTYLGRTLIDRVEGSTPQFLNRLRLLDARGYWLRAATPDLEWGFQLPERAGLTLARSEPMLWEEIARQPHGQLRRGGGLFTWQRVTPGEIVAPGQAPSVSDEEFLVVASEVPPDEFEALFAGLRRTFLVLAPVLLALALSSAWFVHSRRRSWAALKESEARYRTLFESIDEGFCVVEMIFDDDGRAVDYRFLELNPAFEKQSGLSSALGKRMREFAPDLESYWFESLGRVATTGEAVRIQNQAEPLGRAYDVHALRFGAPGDRQVAILFSDITERERMRAELDKFFSLSLDCLCISGDDGHFKLVSPAITDILGWTPEEFLATPYIDLVHPDDREATLAAVERQLGSGARVLQFENRYRHRDGSWRVLSWRSVPQGRLMYGTARDVTEVKEMERALREANDRLERRVQERTAELQETNESLRLSERRFRALIEHGADAIAVVDEGGTAVYLSPSVSSVEGFTAEEMSGRSRLERVHPDDVPKAREFARQLLARPGHPVPMLWRKQHRNGRWMWLEGVATNLLSDPAVNGIVTNYRDVTERKRAEEEIGRLNADLERRVEERTAQLEVVNKELESFSYSVSHDLRAPLRHVQGFVEMLTAEVQDGLSATAQRYLGIISTAAGDMGRLIDDLLSFSKMGRSEMHETTIELDQLVERSRRELAFAVKDRNVTWTVGPLPAVEGDPGMLQLLLANLLGNAVKYTRGRDPARIEVGCGGSEGDRVVLFVRDNGAGFDMRYAHKLFGVFQRLHRVDEFEGTGIGLANVRRIVTRHGGRTWAEGSVGQGATFYFTLKAGAEAAAGAAREHRS
ncbi:MAG: PAS domain S-box protein [Vicinamibacteria bacterium]